MSTRLNLQQNNAVPKELTQESHLRPAHSLLWCHYTSKDIHTHTCYNIQWGCGGVGSMHRRVIPREYNMPSNTALQSIRSQLFLPTIPPKIHWTCRHVFRFSWHSRVSVSLSTQRASFCTCVKSCSISFLDMAVLSRVGFRVALHHCAAMGIPVYCVCVLHVIDWIGMFSGTLRRQTLHASHMHTYIHTHRQIDREIQTFPHGVGHLSRSVRASLRLTPNIKQHMLKLYMACLFHVQKMVTILSKYLVPPSPAWWW